MLRRTIAAIAGAFLICIAAYNAPVAQAQTAPRGVTVSPPSMELYANPGESVTEKIRVTNDSDASNTYSVAVEDFKAVGEEGSVDLIDNDANNTSYSLASWVMPEPKRFTLAAGADRFVTFSINVPKNAEPGGHYASVLIAMGEGADLSAGGAAVTSRVGTLILLRVSGNVKEEASIESFDTTNKYYEGSPVEFDLRLKNNGNNHIKPTGTIVITNVFGQKITEIPLNGMNVLPDAIRKMNTEWKFSAFLANRYTATLVATYGQQNLPLSATTSFYIFPKYMLYVVGGVILLLVLIFANKKKIRRSLHNLTK